MEKYLLILDPGHGGIIDGKPVTAGKRSPDDKFIEGVFNRLMCQAIHDFAKANYPEIKIEFTVDPSNQNDIRLSDRAKRANSFSYPTRQLLISMHADAQPTWLINIKGAWVRYNSGNAEHKRIFDTYRNNKNYVTWMNDWGIARGISVFVYTKSNTSNIIAKEFIVPAIEDEMKDIQRIRKPSHSQNYWTGNFAIVRDTHMPAILIESGFMTNKEDVALMESIGYRARLAKAVVEGAYNYFNKSPR